MVIRLFINAFFLDIHALITRMKHFEDQYVKNNKTNNNDNKNLKMFSYICVIIVKIYQEMNEQVKNIFWRCSRLDILSTLLHFAQP